MMRVDNMYKEYYRYLNRFLPAAEKNMSEGRKHVHND